LKVGESREDRNAGSKKDKIVKDNSNCREKENLEIEGRKKERNLSSVKIGH
jgi:hypothetical protein